MKIKSKLQHFLGNSGTQGEFSLIQQAFDIIYTRPDLFHFQTWFITESDEVFRLYFSGKFYEAAFDIIRAVAQAHAAGMNNPDRGVDIETLRKYLRLATDSRSTKFARSTLGKTLYAFFKVDISFSMDLNAGLSIDKISFWSACLHLLPCTSGHVNIIWQDAIQSKCMHTKCKERLLPK